MAAGEGRRMGPLTERWPKPILPIDGRPVIASLLRELAAAEAGLVFVVTGHLADQVEQLLGDGSTYGVELRFVRQPRPDGSADTVRRARAAGAALPMIVVGADNLFTRGDVGRFASAFAAAESAVAFAVRPSGTPAPLWGLGRAAAPFLEDLPGPPFELLETRRRAREAGKTVRKITIGHTRDLTNALDLMNQNFPYLRAYD